MKSISFLGALASAVLFLGVNGVENGLARTPQMGWNNWNAFGCNVSEKLLLDTAQKIVDYGLRDLGYYYVVLDDCWSSGRNAAGELEHDPERFPHGMKYVADKLHEMQLGFGMYSSAGVLTCARYEGSLDWEEQDAKSWASWDVDYIKYDNCYNKGRSGNPLISSQRYEKMWDAINATGRPMLYSLCNWGEDMTHTWAPTMSNSWRMSGDIYDSFTRPDSLCSCSADDAHFPLCVAPGSHCSVLNIINKVAGYSDRGMPGAWNDLDMLEVGNGGMSDNEYVAHFSMWAAVKSAMLLGNDMRYLTAKDLSIVSNQAVLAISQDPLGRSAQRIARNRTVPKDQYGMGETQIWSGPLYGGDQVVVFLNAAAQDLEMSTTLEEVFFQQGPHGTAPHVFEQWDLYDLWALRMPESEAQKILDGETPVNSLKTGNDYKEALRNGDPTVIGKKVGSLGPGRYEVLKAKVKSHSVVMWRMRQTSHNYKGRQYSNVKQDL